MSNNLFQARFSEQSVVSLQQLLGLSVYRIESPSLEVRGNTITAFSFSLEAEGKGYLAIECERLETPIDFIDYWELSAEFLENPKYIESETRADGLKYFTSQVSSIELTEWTEIVSPIIEIKVYEQEDWFIDNKNEIIAYDCAILFVCENKKRFCIAVSANIPGALDFTQRDLAIDLILKECTLRLEIC